MDCDLNCKWGGGENFLPEVHLVNVFQQQKSKLEYYSMGNTLSHPKVKLFHILSYGVRISQDLLG